MSGFSADWLGMREPFDAAARSSALVAELRRHVARGTHDAPLAAVDLGAGAGSNLRYLAPRLGGAQSWRLVDHDEVLLGTALTATAAWATARAEPVIHHGTSLAIDAVGGAIGVRCELRDLSALENFVLPIGALVTGAALLDLVSRDWLAALIERCRAARATVTFALTYDGRTRCSPREPEDDEILALFNRHQLGNKGFGPALGPGAASAAATALEAARFSVVAQPSDWVIGRTATAMQHSLLDGWLGAALEVAPARRAALTAWHARRRAHVLAGRSELRVGHVDLVGWL